MVGRSLAQKPLPPRRRGFGLPGDGVAEPLGDGRGEVGLGGVVADGFFSGGKFERGLLGLLGLPLDDLLLLLLLFVLELGIAGVHGVGSR